MNSYKFLYFNVSDYQFVTKINDMIIKVGLISESNLRVYNNYDSEIIECDNNMNCLFLMLDMFKFETGNIVNDFDSYDDEIQFIKSITMDFYVKNRITNTKSARS